MFDGITNGTASSSSVQPRHSQTKAQQITIAICLLTITWIAFFPTLQCGFIWDDDNYVTQNMTLRTVSGLHDIWLKPNSIPQYYPLVHSSFWCEYQLWGLNPVGYHLINVLIHGINAVLLERILRRIAPTYSVATAILFAIHPMQVESVAWVTERKNLLSGLFYLSAISYYLHWRDSPVERRRLLMVFVFYLCALLSKTTAVSLPVVLAIMTWSLGQRIERREVGVWATLIAVGLPFAAMTVWLEREHVGAIGHHWDWGFGDRCLIASQAFSFYPWKFVSPNPIVFIYPKWDIHSTASEFAGAAATIAVVIAIAWRQRAYLGCLGCHLMIIFPALGFFNIYPMRYTWVADHYQYIANIPLSLGLILLWHQLVQHGLAWFGCDRDHRAKLIMWLMLIPLTGLLLWKTSLETEKYVDSESLWADTLAKDPGCEMAWINLGNHYRSQGRLPEAVRCFRTALPLTKNDPTAAINLASTLVLMGQRAEGLRQLHLMAQFESTETWLAHFNLAVLYSEEDQDELALEHLTKALQQRPQESTLLNLRGLIALKQGDPKLAVTYLEQAVSKQPYFVEGRVNLGVALDRLGQTERAVQEWDQVLDLVPNHPEALRNRRLRSTQP